MRKLTVILIAALFGLAMASCDTTPKETPHEKIMKQCNEFFSNLENEVKNVSNKRKQTFRRLCLPTTAIRTEM